MNELASYDRGSEYTYPGFSATVAENLKISAKSTRMVHRILSLLKLPRKMQRAVGEGTLPVSQRYLFATHLDCPDISTIFVEVTQKPVTNAALEKMLITAKKTEENLVTVTK
jgi:hypothetical protein